MSEKLFKKNGKNYFRLESGTVIRIRHISELTIAEAARTVKKPEAPLQDIIDPVTEKVIGQERNESHPDYQADLIAYQEEVQKENQHTAFILGIKDIEVDYEAVKELREDYKALYGKELDSNDTYVYITNFLIPSFAELNKVADAILGSSIPTEEVVASALEQFPANVA